MPVLATFPKVLQEFAISFQSELASVPSVHGLQLLIGWSGDCVELIPVDNDRRADFSEFREAMERVLMDFPKVIYMGEFRFGLSMDAVHPKKPPKSKKQT